MLEKIPNYAKKNVLGKTALNNILRNKNEDDFNKNYYRSFERLYENHAPKIYGYLIKNTYSKQQADKFLVNVFLSLWDNIETVDKDPDKQIMKIFLQVCKPLYKSIRVISTEMSF